MVFFQQKLQLNDGNSVVQMLLQFCNVGLLTFVVHMWVTKRNENMGRMGKTIQELKEAEKSKDDFLSNVSHEIRTPINTICGISEILLQSPLDEKSGALYSGSGKKPYFCGK